MSILFSTPCYGGQATAPHFVSALELKEALDLHGIKHDWNVVWNESLIHRARMEMTRMFLETDHTHLMWLDADIEFRATDVNTLWNLNVDIAVAAYAMKRLDMPLSAWRNGKMVRLEECPTEPFEVDYAGTGFMLISRKAIEAVHEFLKSREQACKDLVAELSENLSDEKQKLLRLMLDGVASSYEGSRGRVPALFMTPIRNDCLLSEDYFFCQSARDAGFKIIMDPSVRLGHWGQFRYGAPKLEG